MENTSKLRRIALVATLMFAVVATAASGSEDSSSGSGGEKKTDSGVSSGIGSADASADVSGPKIVREGEAEFQIVYGEVTIKNASSKRSDYFVTVVAESPDGTTRHDETIVAVSGLEPDQTSTEKGLFSKDIPADAILKVQEVQRTASV